LDKGSDDLQHERHASTVTTGREEKVLGHKFMGELRRTMVHAMNIIYT